MNIHFIAIGGAVMHNMAIALHQQGNVVTGSDDEIFEPARGRLERHGILPAATGWSPEKIHTGLDAVILGMHAREDNPELIRAKELGIRIYSFPEYIYEQSKNKTRVVIGGSHGKTTITAMIMHVLRQCGVDFDYMVGAQLEGFDTMFRISPEAKIIILEGDEYLTSTLDPRPKFHLYRPGIALLSGIAWDHINVFPTFEIYLDQFRQFIRLIEPGGALIYCSDDEELEQMAQGAPSGIQKIPYELPPHEIRSGITYVRDDETEYALNIFGRHNLLNLNGARQVCLQLGIDGKRFMQAISSFRGAAKRLELLATNAFTTVFKDFAHSPSKLKATIAAVKEQFPGRHLVACMELHTFSSLNADFLRQYDQCMKQADTAVVYFNPHTLALKKMPPLSSEMIKEAFGRSDLQVFNDAAMLRNMLTSAEWKNKNLLMMSSGSFDGTDLAQLAKEVCES